MGSSSTLELPLGNCTIPGGSGQSKIYSWGVLVTVGTGTGMQQLCLHPSTVVNSTLLISSDTCSSQNLNKDPSESLQQCRSRRGGYLNKAVLKAASVESLPSDPGWPNLQITASGPKAVTSAVKESLHLRADDQVEFIEGLIEGGQDHTASHLGLGDASSFLKALVDAGRIAKRTFSINAGSTSILQPRSGNIVFGGFDDSSVKGPWSKFPIAQKAVGQRTCPLTVTIKEWLIRVPGRNDATLIAQDQVLQACIEP
jgi:hypothetical protein